MIIFSLCNLKGGMFFYFFNHNFLRRSSISHNGFSKILDNSYSETPFLKRLSSLWSSSLVRYTEIPFCSLFVLIDFSFSHHVLPQIYSFIFSINCLPYLLIFSGPIHFIFIISSSVVGLLLVSNISVSFEKIQNDDILLCFASSYLSSDNLSYRPSFCISISFLRKR